jgi:hypothetical protein
MLALVSLPGRSEAARYAGERINVISGQQEGRWIIKTRRLAGQDVLSTTVRCKPGARCRPWPRRLRIDMVPGAGEYDWNGSFDVNGVTCQLEAYVYDQGFEGTYDCAGQTFGSISGRVVQHTPPPNPYP